LNHAIACEPHTSYAVDFAQLWDDSVAIFSLIDDPKSNEFAEVAESPSGTVRVRLQNFDLRGAQARLIRLHSPKADVFSAFIYPEPQSAAPIYAMEFVMLGGRPIVAVIDLVNLCEDETARLTSDALMNRARTRYPHPNNDDVPQWYLDCRSGREMFHRPTHADAFDALGAAHLQLLESLRTGFSGSTQVWPNSKDAPAHATAIAHYKTHHSEHSPGRPILTRLFGEAWTNSFLADKAFA
jgi:hypothetical protein